MATTNAPFAISILCLASGLLIGCAREPAFPEEPARDWARPLRSIELESSDARIARGRYLTNALLRCRNCHGERDLALPGEPPIPGREFVGRVYWEDSTRRIVAPNLTPDPETGVGRWSDDMLLRAIREGVGHDGRALHSFMPYRNFRSLSDEDAASIVVFLRSLPPVYNELPKTRLSQESRRRIERKLKPLTERIPMPDTADAVTRGRYYIDLADCVGCHTSWYTDYNPGLLAGGNRISRVQNGKRREVFSSNITSDPSGIGGLDSAGFIALVRSGRGGSMDPVMPWVTFGSLSDRDLGAILQGLRSVAPARHWISNGPPSPCAVCEQEHGLGDRNQRARPHGVRLPAAALDELAGTYRSDELDWTFTITREGSRLFGLDEEDHVELIPIGVNRCVVPGWASPLAFERDTLGKVVAMVSEEIPPVRLARVGVY